MYKNFIFDLDGTLADTAPDIIDCLSLAYQEVGVVGFETMDKSYIGPPLAEIIKRITPKITPADQTKIISQFRHCYDNSSYPKTELIDGVYETLMSLKQFNLYVITNKLNLPSMRILSKLKISSYFADIITPDCEPNSRYSKKEMAALLLKRRQLLCSETIMIGDGQSDIISANENQIDSAAFLGGYGNSEDLRNCQPTYLLDKISNLVKIAANT